MSRSTRRDDRSRSRLHAGEVGTLSHLLDFDFGEQDLVMAEAFLVRARGQTNGRPNDFLYAASAETPDEAVALVSRLVAPGTSLDANGDTLSPISAKAIRLSPGQAKLL